MSVDPQRVDRAAVDYSSDVLTIMRGMPGWPAADVAPEPGALRVLTHDPRRATRLSAEVVDELRRRLREAEAREGSPEGSGVREIPAAPGEPVALEVGVAPRSDSGFYAAFDDDDPQGVFVATYRRIPVGTPVSITVWFPGDEAFEAETVVEWVREAEAEAPGLPAGVGLAWVRLEPEALELVRASARVRPPIFYAG